MTRLVIVIGVVLAVIVGVFVVLFCHRTKTGTDPQRTKSRDACLALRQQILALNPDSAGIKSFVGTNQVWGCVMEMGFPNATVTLTALADGNASLYFSSGGGVIGGIGHEKVRKATSRMSQVADGFVSSCSPATEFPFPKQDETVFYILTKSGKVTIKASANDLGENRHPLSPLFYAGQDVITELRLVTNNFE